MVSASLIKLFIMGAVYDAERSGTLTPGAQEDAICQMISISDNAAANELTCLLGGGSEADGRAAVERFAASIDCTAVRYNRLMLVENGTQNYVSAEDCAAFLRLVYNRQCVSQEASEPDACAPACPAGERPHPARGLPEGTQCAHKTGDLLGLCCADVGIVFTSQTDFLLLHHLQRSRRLPNCDPDLHHPRPHRRREALQLTGISRKSSGLRLETAGAAC